MDFNPFEMQKSAHAHMMSERSKLIDLSFNTTKQLDQIKLVISAGILSVALSLSDGPTTSVFSAIMLCSVWILFCVTIVLTTYSLVASQKAMETEINNKIEEYKNAITGQTDVIYQNNCWSKLTRCLNNISTASFALGWLSVSSYVIKLIIGG